ncbi:Di-copper centre-containing protein [Ascobolus immersus RN42]|uniref:Di-copper centre-containing protein n=1 Tax=Ascobolus immersus RN42 TaxID=1160509 RepID=A0A3N4HQU2_ASCIM|nr:Di-copper centre-containing protein [Ascobolus immersus RN42]
MRFDLTSFITLALLAVPALSAPAPQRPGKPGKPGKPDQNACTNPQERKEWRQLSIPQRVDFLNAVRCLHQIPATRNNEYPGTGSDYEAFTVQHKIQTPWVHYTGLFLPWHRLFLREFERSLQEKCGYQGALPYWDYTIDSGSGKNFTIESPVFHPEHGFGGNGEFDKNVHDILAAQGTPDFWGGGCVKTGPFKDMTFTVPQERYFNESTAPRCLKRNFFLAFTEWTTQDKEDAVYEQTNFEDMEFMLEGGHIPGQWAALHTGGHFIVGGLMPQGAYTTAGDVWTSSLEPLFYLHHANIDRVWNQWQIQNNSEHLWDIGLKTSPRADNVFGPNEDFNFVDAPVTHSTPVDLGAFGGARNQVAVGQLLDTRGGASPEGQKGVLCYKYSQPPKPARSS